MTSPNGILWTAGFFNERFPAPVSPLGWSLLGPLIEDIALREPLCYLGLAQAHTMPLTRLWHGHPYTNVLAFQTFYKLFPDSLLPEDVYRYFPDGDISFRKQTPYPRSILSPRFLYSLSKSFIADPANFSPLHNYQKWARYVQEHDSRVLALNGRLAALANADTKEVFTALEEAEAIHRRFLRIHRWSLMHADLIFGLLKQLARIWVDRECGAEIAAKWVAGTNNKTMQVDADLRKLAKEIGPALRDVKTSSEFVLQASREMLSAFDRFLALHGHRSFSLDIAVPTFQDEPIQVVYLLRAIEERKPDPPTDAQLLAQAPRIKRQVLDSVRSLAVKYVVLREDQRYYWQKSLAVSRHLYLNLGERLAASGILPKREHVFHLTHSELLNFFQGMKIDLTAIAAARQVEWATFERQAREAPDSAYPQFLRNDTPLIQFRARRQTWQGRAVSPGSTRGVARIVHSARELMQVQRGDVLIAPSTDPAWTPVFSRINALVLERGGVLSHGAVVAREYHVPAVAGIANIANEIENGEMISVDGNKGVVKRLED